MSNLFSGLEQFGLSNLGDIDVYDKEESQQQTSGKKEPVKLVESDYLFDKTYTCPACDHEFKSKAVKTGKVKLLSADTDLRPKYQFVDSLKYDAVVCPQCGYAALNRYFNYMTSKQAKMIKEKISATYKGKECTEDMYDYDEAISRHKLALVNTVVKGSKLSERAYTCLKIAWLVRGKAESLPQETPDYGKVKAELEAEEKEFILNAYEGFTGAFSKELFPMCGMDENTVTYLVADLARRSGKMDEAARLVSKVLVSRDANERIKNKARSLKELIIKLK